MNHLKAPTKTKTNAKTNNKTNAKTKPKTKPTNAKTKPGVASFAERTLQQIVERLDKLMKYLPKGLQKK